MKTILILYFLINSCPNFCQTSFVSEEVSKFPKDTTILIDIAAGIDSVSNVIKNSANNLPDTIYFKIVSIIFFSKTLQAHYITHSDLFSSEYIKSLQNNLNILKDIKRILQKNSTLTSDTLKKVYQNLDYVDKDFSSKNLRLNFSDDTQVSGYKYNDIKVVVNVLKNNVKQNGYSITASPEFWFDSQPIYTFNSLSSPTSRNLPPGEYIFSIFINGKKLNDTRIIIPENRNDFTSNVFLYLDK